MTKQEFETLTKRNVSEEMFDNVNRLYMAAGEMTKDDFCEAYIKLTSLDWGNPIIHDIVEHCEQLARNTTGLSAAVRDLQYQTDAARENMSNMQKEIDRLKAQIELRDEKIMQMQTVQDAVETHIDLEDEKEVREAFEKAYGKLYTIRMRYENSWELNDEEILWLIQHAEE